MSDSNETAADRDNDLQLDINNLHKLTVVKLKDALTHYDIQFPKKALKQELIDILHSYLTTHGNNDATTTSAFTKEINTDDDRNISVTTKDGDINSEEENSTVNNDDTINQSSSSSPPASNAIAADGEAIDNNDDGAGGVSVGEHQSDDDNTRRHSKRRKVALNDNNHDTNKGNKKENFDKGPLSELSSAGDVPFEAKIDGDDVSLSRSRDADAGGEKDADTDVISSLLTNSTDNPQQQPLKHLQQQQQVQASTILPKAQSQRDEESKSNLTADISSPSTGTTLSTSAATLYDHDDQVPSAPSATKYTPAATTAGTGVTSNKNQQHSAPDKEVSNKEDKSTLKFYNYTPRDPELQKQRVNVIQIEKDEEWVNVQLKPLLDIGSGVEQVDELQYLAPRNLNADLKRDLKGKYEILQQRTKSAINRIVKNKMEEEEKEREKR